MTHARISTNGREWSASEQEAHFSRIVKNIERNKTYLFSEKQGTLPIESWVQEEYACEGKKVAHDRMIDYLRHKKLEPIQFEDKLLTDECGDEADKTFGMDREQSWFMIDSAEEESVKMAAGSIYQVEEKIDINKLISAFWDRLDDRKKLLLSCLMYKHDLIEALSPELRETIYSLLEKTSITDRSDGGKLKDYEISTILGYSPKDNARKGFNYSLDTLRREFFELLSSVNYFGKEEKTWNSNSLQNLSKNYQM